MSGSCDEYCDIHKHSVRRARKAHVCSACRANIRPGDHYAEVFTLFEGTAETFKRCGSCEVTWQHLFKLCQEYNRTRRSGGPLYPYEDLSCGLSYREEWGDVPDDIAALPLLSADERGKLLCPKVSP